MVESADSNSWPGEWEWLHSGPRARPTIGAHGRQRRIHGRPCPSPGRAPGPMKVGETSAARAEVVAVGQPDGGQVGSASGPPAGRRPARTPAPGGASRRAGPVDARLVRFGRATRRYLTVSIVLGV